MRSVTLKELFDIAVNSRDEIWEKANSLNRDVKVYLHWTAGKYTQKFEDYHVNITGDGKVYVSTDNLADILAHTYKRNTGAVGVCLCCAYGATTEDLGDYAPTQIQIEVMSQVIVVLARALNLTIDRYRVMTHGEAGDNIDGLSPHEQYGQNTTVEKWDLAILSNGDIWGSGGDTLRGKANFYKDIKF